MNSFPGTDPIFTPRDIKPMRIVEQALVQVLFTALLGLVLSWPGAIIVGTILVLFSAFPEKRLTLIRCTPFVLPLCLSLIPGAVPGLGNASLAQRISWEVAGLATVLTINAGLLFVSWRVRFPVLFLIFSCVGILGGLHWVCGAFGAPSFVYARWGWYFVLSFWGIVYLAVHAPSDKGFARTLASLGFATPIWGTMYPTVPLFRNEEEFQKFARPRESLLQSQWSAVKYLTVLCFALLLRTLLCRALFNPGLGISNQGYFVVDRQFTIDVLSRLSGFGQVKWLIAGYIRYASHLLNFAIYVGAEVCVARMAGFHALRAVYRPLEAKGFSNFYFRYFHYHCKLLMEVFYRQLNFLLADWGLNQSPRWRMYALLIAIAGGGWIASLPLLTVQYPGKGVFVLLWARLFQGIHNVFIAASILVALNSKQSFQKILPWPPLRILAYLLIQGAAYSILAFVLLKREHWPS